MNYTFFGSENYNYTGIWLEMNMKFNKKEIKINADASTADYDITFKMFVAFGASPIEGVEGAMGIGYVTKFWDY